MVVARDGGFVTCLGKGMSTGALPVVSRAHLDGPATKVERVREGLALARKRGIDEARFLERVESAGPAVSREDFKGASAMVGPAIPLLMEMYTSWATTVEEIYPLLLSVRGDSVRLRPAEQAPRARGVGDGPLRDVAGRLGAARVGARVGEPARAQRAVALGAS